MKNLNKKVRELMALPWEQEYRFERIPEEDGGGIYGYVTLFGKSGCCADSDTPEETIKNLRDSLEVVIEHYLEMGWDVPEPKKQVM